MKFRLRLTVLRLAVIRETVIRVIFIVVAELREEALGKVDAKDASRECAVR